MKKCGKCGYMASDDSLFCPKDGNKLETDAAEDTGARKKGGASKRSGVSVKKCANPKCGLELGPDDRFFCPKCGWKIKSVAGPGGGGDDSVRPGMLRIRCLPHYTDCSYSVVVNGKNLGAITVGNIIDAGVDSDTVAVEIISELPGNKNRRKLKLNLRPSVSPVVDFKCDFTGYPLITVGDAEILEQKRC